MHAPFRADHVGSLLRPHELHDMREQVRMGKASAAKLKEAEDRLIRDVVAVAANAGKGVSLCGEMAGDVVYTVLLVGIGLRELSLAPRAIPEIKKAIRSITVEESRDAAAWCLAARDAC